MLTVTDVTVSTRNRTNNDIHISDVLSKDDPADSCSSASSGDEFTDMVFITVITLGVAEIITVLVSMVVEVELMSCVLVTTDVVLMVLVMVAISVSDSTSVLVLVVMVVEVELMSLVLVRTDVVITELVMVVVTE